MNTLHLGPVVSRYGEVPADSALNHIWGHPQGSVCECHIEQEEVPISITDDAGVETCGHLTVSNLAEVERDRTRVWIIDGVVTDAYMASRPIKAAVLRGPVFANFGICEIID